MFMVKICIEHLDDIRYFKRIYVLTEISIAQLQGITINLHVNCICGLPRPCMLSGVSMHGGYSQKQNQNQNQII